MKPYLIFCKNKLDGEYEVEMIMADENLSLNEVKNKAYWELSSVYSVLSVVSTEWSKLYIKYAKLFIKCEEQNLFEKFDANEALGNCCGYNIGVNNICNYGRVILGYRTPFEMNIENLSEEQFENVVLALKKIFEIQANNY